MAMGLPDEFSPDYGDFDPFFSHIGTSYDPDNQFGDYLCLGDLWNHPPTTPPWQLPLPSLRPNDEPSGPCVTREDQLHPTAPSELGRDYSSNQVLVMECSAAESQGGFIGSSTQSLPAFNPVTLKQRGRKLSLDRSRTTRPTIGLEDLQRHFGKNRTEAAKSLNVSVPTLKRISRLYGIARWPFNKSKKRVMSAKVVDESLLSPTCSSYVVVDAVSSMLPESEITSPPKQLGSETDAKKKEKPMTVKVHYRDDCVKFEIFSLSKADLEEKISNRLKLKIGSFKVKYLDEEGDWISITCDVDLQLCKKSVGTTTVKMSVMPSPT